MAFNAAGVANYALADIASKDLQLQLADEAVLLPVVMDLSSQATEGKKSISIPLVSGMSTQAMLEDGNEQTSSGMTITPETLSLNNFRVLPDYIYDGSIQSAVEIEAAFFQNAPAVFIEYVESVIYAELDGASASNPDHILQMSGTDNLVPTVADIRLAAQLLDVQKAPQGDRYLAVNPKIKQAILSLSEVTDASKFGNANAIQKNVIAEICGFKVIVSNQVTTNTCVAFHKSSLAFAAQKKLTPVKERQESKNRTYIALKMFFGVKTLRGGKMAVLLNATGS